MFVSELFFTPSMVDLRPPEKIWEKARHLPIETEVAAAVSDRGQTYLCQAIKAGVLKRRPHSNLSPDARSFHPRHPPVPVKRVVFVQSDGQLYAPVSQPVTTQRPMTYAAAVQFRPIRTDDERVRDWIAGTAAASPILQTNASFSSGSEDSSTASYSAASSSNISGETSWSFSNLPMSPIPHAVADQSYITEESGSYEEPLFHSSSIETSYDQFFYSLQDPDRSSMAEEQYYSCAQTFSYLQC
jgi:hypothetical protein